MEEKQEKRSTVQPIPDALQEIHECGKRKMAGRKKEDYFTGGPPRRKKENAASRETDPCPRGPPKAALERKKGVHMPKISMISPRKKKDALVNSLEHARSPEIRGGELLSYSKGKGGGIHSIKENNLMSRRFEKKKRRSVRAGELRGKDCRTKMGGLQRQGERQAYLNVSMRKEALGAKSPACRRVKGGKKVIRICEKGKCRSRIGQTCTSQ